MAEKLKVGVLVSGSGTNLQAIIDAQAEGLPIEVAHVVSSRPDAYGIERAKAAGIPVLVMNKGLYADPRAADEMIADTLKANLLWISLAVFGVVAGSFLFVRTPGGRAWWDAQKLKLPIVGPIFHKLALTRFARTTASLLHSGVPILETLNVVAISVGNLKMEDALKEIAVKIEQGETLSGAMSQYPIFPRIILRMVMAGEQGGAVDTMLEKIADYMDDELEHTLSGLTSLIEPLLIIFLGVMIGGMVLAMFLPVFDLVNQVR